MRQGCYYLGRVIKVGNLNQETLQEALLNPTKIPLGKFKWGITDVFDGRNTSTPFIFGKLTKYVSEGEVKVVDEQSKQQVSESVDDLLKASAPFVYLPDFSGIAFLHVWNLIEEDTFRRRFKSIIEAKYSNFFVDCSIEPVTDYNAFYQKLKNIDKFIEISAKIYPPNPLFGRLWESLNDYVKKRNASEVVVKETASNPKGLSTNIVDLVKNIMKDPQFSPKQPPDITDAAILMAADGYGSGTARGIEHGQPVLIRTSDNQKSFLFSKDPIPEELAKAAYAYFTKISEERDMRHK